jgi:hypothetical protein
MQTSAAGGAATDRPFDEWFRMIEDCEARDSRLTDWERTFIDSVQRQLEGERPLSQKQRGILDEVWERVTEAG